MMILSLASGFFRGISMQLVGSQDVAIPRYGKEIRWSEPCNGCIVQTLLPMPNSGFILAHGRQMKRMGLKGCNICWDTDSSCREKLDYCPIWNIPPSKIGKTWHQSIPKSFLQCLQGSSNCKTNMTGAEDSVQLITRICSSTAPSLPSSLSGDAVIFLKALEQLRKKAVDRAILLAAERRNKAGRGGLVKDPKMRRGRCIFAPWGWKGRSGWWKWRGASGLHCDVPCVGWQMHLWDPFEIVNRGTSPRE